FSRLRAGERPGRIPTLAEAEAHDWTVAEFDFVRTRNAQQAVGDLAHVTERIESLAESTQADELIVVPQGPDLATKLRTLNDLAGGLDKLDPRGPS
ncbi:MAG TPA: hypothetical protein VIJ11_02375, partial [Galbitalea sp.]